MRESKLSCGCAVHILLALMVLTWLDCCGAFEDGNVFPKKRLKVGALFEVGINVHMSQNMGQKPRVSNKSKTWF